VFTTDSSTNPNPSLLGTAMRHGKRAGSALHAGEVEAEEARPRRRPDQEEAELDLETTHDVRAEN
jgi:hypothetical protein